MFFPELGDPATPWRDLCASCPVQSDCLEYAMADPQIVGFWGGTTDRERKRIRGERRRAA